MDKTEVYQEPSNLKKWWWKLSSYGWERVLERSSSPYNPVLEVWYAYGRLMLNTEQVNLGFGLLDKEFRVAFKKLEIGKRDIKSVLLLGVGPGNVPDILREFGGSYQITGVEIDPEVIRLARKYFGLDSYPGLRIEIADATEWIRRCQDRYDLIISDLFLDEVIPENALQADYFRRLIALLNPGGIVLYNRLMHKSQLKYDTLAFTRKMQEAIPGTRYIQAHQNRMLFYENK